MAGRFIRFYRLIRIQCFATIRFLINRGIVILNRNITSRIRHIDNNSKEKITIQPHVGAHD